MKFDAIIIGFGNGGKTLAGALAKQGIEVALIERSRGMYGGTCINVGCIPSKLLVSSAAASELAGGGFEEKAARYAAAVAEKRRVTALLRGKNYSKLNELPKVSIFDGVGSFAAPKQVRVALTDGGEALLEAENIFINTGSESIIPGFPGIAGNSAAYTSETLMDESALPRRLTLIGAGYIGMEFASMYAAFGSEVTVIQDGAVFLPKEDRDVADEIRAILERRGVKFLIGAKPVRLDLGNTVYEKDGAEQFLAGDAVLLATGRRANTAALDAGKAGVALTPRGAVQVDEQLRTTAPGVWAMGDVNGGPQFTFVSLDDYRIVLSQLNGGEGTRESRKNLPYSVFMSVPLGRVGLTEEQARAKGLPIKVLKLPTAAVPKAQVLRQTDGFLKAIVNTETGKILGAALLCPEAYELINTVKLAMDMDADYTVLRDRIYTHPTMTEAFNDLFAL